MIPPSLPHRAPTEPSSNGTRPVPDELSEPQAIPAHPLGVKPSGNGLMETWSLRSSIGYFQALPDIMILSLLATLDSADLLALGSTCKAMYAFTRSEELWKASFTEKLPKDFTWRGTWRGTYLNLPTSKFASPDCSRLYSDTFHRPFYCAHISLAPYVEGIPARNQIARLPDLTPAEFEKSWINKPFILTEPVKSWPLYKTWSLETLAKQYAETIYRIDVVDWPFKTYVDYMKDNSDESPMYLFDSEFVGKMGLKTEGENADYIPPPAFGEDFFDVFGAQRPDYQWLIIGPERSGSPFHKDPNATSAWNAVITGAKYWIMFPGDTVPPGIYVSDDGDVTSPLSNAEWLLNFHAAARKAPGCMEGICDEGEVLHIPSGWWHLVVNLSPAIAVTENFVPRGHLASALDFLKNKADQITGFKKDVADPYALFVERMADAFPDILEEGMKELEAKRKKRKWEDVVKQTEEDEDGEGGGFSFGFGGDDSDAEVP